MKRVLVYFLLFALSAAARDVTGAWSGTFRANGGDHTIPQMMIFKQDGTKLNGSAGPDAQEQYPIENGKVEGDHLKFEVTTAEWRFSYDLTRSGEDEINGSLELKSVNSGRTAIVTLKRVK